MELSGGYYGGYEYLGNQIQLGDIVLSVNQTQNVDEFYILDDNNVKYFYRIDSDSIVFIGFE